MKRLLISSLATVVGSAAVLAHAGSPAAAADRPFVLTHGHIDLFDVTYDQADGRLDLSVGDDTGLHAAGKVHRDPSQVTVAVDAEASAVQVPDLPAYAFLGDPGDTVHLLPQSETAGLPWPGWSTERLTGSLPAGTEISPAADAVRLAVDVEGPGDVHTYMNGATGGVINHYVDTTDPAPDTIPVARNAHVHTEWVFTEVGEYTLTVTPSATTTTGATLAGDPATYHVRVGDAAVVPHLGLSVTADREGASYLYGQGITLTVAPDAATDLDHYHWFVKRAGQDDYVVSDRSATDVLKLPTSPVWDGAQVVAKLYGDDHEVVAESAPITLSVTTLPATTTLSVAADRASCRAGETAHLSSAQSPQTADDHYHWYVRAPGEEFYTWIDGTSEADASLPITADLDGASVVVRLFDGNHAVLAESAPYVLTVGDGAAASTTTTLALGRAKARFGAATRATVSVASATGPAAGRVSLASGDRVVARADLDARGRAVVVLPARLAPGAHRLVARFTPADAAQQAASASGVARYVVLKAPARVRTTLRPQRVRTAARARVVVRVTGAAVARGRVHVLDRGRRVATGVLRQGRAVVRLPRLAPGVHPLRVRYAGDARHLPATGPVQRLRVVRG